MAGIGGYGSRSLTKTEFELIGDRCYATVPSPRGTVITKTFTPKLKLCVGISLVAAPILFGKKK